MARKRTYRADVLLPDGTYVSARCQDAGTQSYALVRGNWTATSKRHNSADMRTTRDAVATVTVSTVLADYRGRCFSLQTIQGPYAAAYAAACLPGARIGSDDGKLLAIVEF